MPPSTTSINWATLQNGSDIRGVALEGVAGQAVNLTPEVVTILGKAFATWLSAELERPLDELTIAIGRDSRLSGPELMEAAIAGMTSLGCRVFDVAMASTPAMFMGTVLPEFACHGAIMMTASHLPFNRNGLKVFHPPGRLGQRGYLAHFRAGRAGQFSDCDSPRLGRKPRFNWSLCGGPGAADSPVSEPSRQL
jgi:hypothetical protein